MTRVKIDRCIVKMQTKFHVFIESRTYTERFDRLEEFPTLVVEAQLEEGHIFAKQCGEKRL